MSEVKVKNGRNRVEHKYLVVTSALVIIILFLHQEQAFGFFRLPLPPLCYYF